MLNTRQSEPATKRSVTTNPISVAQKGFQVASQKKLQQEQAQFQEEQQSFESYKLSNNLQSFQDLILESRRKKRGQFAERILALQKKANFELMSIVYDILHKPVRIRVVGSNQIVNTQLTWEDALREACKSGETSIDILLDCEYEFFNKNPLTAPDKINILTGVYSIYDSSKNGYTEFQDGPMLTKELANKVNEKFIFRCEESKFNKTALLHIEIPMPSSVSESPPTQTDDR